MSDISIPMFPNLTCIEIVLFSKLVKFSLEERKNITNAHLKQNTKKIDTEETWQQYVSSLEK
jgi:hypothetical protein